MPQPQTVLVVDDSEVDRATYERFLRRDDRQAYEIVAFATGESALAWCQQYVADVILLDYQLPMMDGLAFLRQLRQLQPEVFLPVILLTGGGNTAIAVEALKLGAQEYIEKARMTQESLLPLVRCVIQQVQLKRQVARQQTQQQHVLESALRMRQTFDQQRSLDGATHDIGQFLQADRVLVYQFAPDWSGVIVSESVRAGWSSALGQQLYDTCFQQGAGWAYRQGHPWAVADIAQANLTDCHRALLERFAVKANLVVPILQTVSVTAEAESKSSLWGLLIAHHCAEVHAWQAEEIAFLQQVAVHLSGAIQQATLYQAAQQQVEELERLNRLKDDFLSTVSHELRTPMSSIKMATQMLEISLQPLGILDDESNVIHRYVKILREQGKREITLINDLLDLTRLDAGTEPLNLTTTNLQVYIPHLAESFSERTQQQQQQLVLHISDQLPAFTTDVPYLERILTELLNNACKYTPASETITVSAQATANDLEIRISNTGVEILPTEYDRVFDKFYRIPNHDPWKYGGTGLGLALVKKMVTCLGGKIRVESGDGKTTFILKFHLLG